MSYNNQHEEESRPVSREEFGELIEILEQILATDSPNIQVALQPTVTVLKELAINQVALKKEAIEDRKKISQLLDRVSDKLKVIDRQNAEIEKLREQSKQQNDWLKEHINGKALVISTLISTVLIAVPLILCQRLVPSNLDNEINQQLKQINKQIENPKKKKN
jgi:hypothetical protein